MESRIGVLEFDDGAPSKRPPGWSDHHLDFARAVDAYLGALPGASLEAIRRGFQRSASKKCIHAVLQPDGLAVAVPTANSDTIYFWGFLDLSQGPKVIDIPPLGAPTGILGTVDDMWFRWLTDVGLPGPDRAQGGRDPFVGPEYDGPLPDGGFFVTHSRTSLITLIGRAFMVDNDPAPALEAIRSGVRISSYVPVLRDRRGLVPRRTVAARPNCREPTRPVSSTHGDVRQHDHSERLPVLDARQ